MEVHQVIDLGREAIVATLLLAAPVLVVGTVVGLLVGLAQALTQIQEQTVAFVPKLVLMLVALSLSMPWLLARLIEYTRQLIVSIPDTLS